MPAKAEAMSDSDFTSTEHLEVFDTLRRLGGDSELLAELYVAFTEDAPVKFEAIGKALDEGDLSLILKGAHSLKGSAAAVGALRCRDLSIAVEHAAREQDLPLTRSMGRHLGEEVGIVVDLILEQMRNGK